MPSQVKNKSASVLVVGPARASRAGLQRLERLVQTLLSENYRVEYYGGIRIAIEPIQGFTQRIMVLPFRKRLVFLLPVAYFLLAPFLVAWSVVRRRPQLILVNSALLAVIASASAVLLRIKLVIFLSEIARSPLPGQSTALSRIRFLIEDIAFSASHTILVPSVAMEQVLRSRFRVLSQKVRVLPPPMRIPAELQNASNKDELVQMWERSVLPNAALRAEIRSRYNAYDDDFIIVTTGELTPKSNVEELFRAVACLANESVKVFVGGEGPEKRRLMSLAVGLGLTRQVIFIGWVSDLNAVLMAADLFFLPFSELKLSNSLLEALSCGVPVIAPRSLPNQELLVDEQLLVEPEDVQELVVKISGILNSDGTLKGIKEKSHARARLLMQNSGSFLGDFIEQM